jgi:hypothetical protein
VKRDVGLGMLQGFKLDSIVGQFFSRGCSRNFARVDCCSNDFWDDEKSGLFSESREMRGRNCWRSHVDDEGVGINW